MNKVLERIKKVFLEILPAFIFFLAMFHMLAISKALILKQYGIIVPATAMAIVWALVIAKVVLIVNRLPFLNMYPRKPLIYTLIAKTFAFTVITILFFLLESYIHLGLKTGGFSGAWDRMNAGIVWPAFWLRQAWVFILILFYCASIELSQALGKDKVKEIFFGRNH